MPAAVPPARVRAARALAATTALIVTWATFAPASAAPRQGGSTGKNRDATPPTVVVGAPAGGASVAGAVRVSGTASDNAGVAAVHVAVDGGSWAPAGGTTAWSASVDTTAYPDGTHTIAARATDAAGNTATASVTVTVDNVPPADTTPPSVSITTPAPGASIGGAVTVAGTAADDVSLAQVTVSVDGGPWAPASGTTTWSVVVDTSALGAGTHTITARAADAAGNAASASVTVNVPAPSSPDDVIVSDPNATYGLSMLGRTRLPTWGSVTGVLAAEAFTQRKIAWFRDASTGATSTVDLPADSRLGWAPLASVMSSPYDLWLLGGGGPLYVRHYRLAGSPLPTSATLVESRTFGDTDSRLGDLMVLRSGAVVAAWHQQGANGLPQGQYVAYRRSDGSWQGLPRLAFMETKASDQVLAQHPADGSVWLFSNPDAWGSIGVARLSESGGVLRLDWTDGYFIRDEVYGLFGPDGEDPFLAVASDPWTGTLALAYQSADRQAFGTLTGTRVAVARIPAVGSPTFTAAPVWAERVTAVGLVVREGETVVSYRPIDETTLTFDDVEVSRHRNGAWEAPVRVGTLGSGTWTVGYGTARPEFAAMLDDGRIHLRTV